MPRYVGFDPRANFSKCLVIACVLCPYLQFMCETLDRGLDLTHAMPGHPLLKVHQLFIHLIIAYVKLVQTKIQTNAHIYAYVHSCAYLHICICPHMSTHISTHMCTHMSLHTHVSTHMSLHTCLHTHVHIHNYTYVYTHGYPHVDSHVDTHV